jgi:sphingosine kinase
VFNGLAGRKDAEKALKLPIGHIPGGSGNALAKSVNHACGESFGVLEAAFLIAKGGIQPLDLMTVLQEGQPQKTSFLTLSGGVISDIDICSERMRFLGSSRFTVYGVLSVIWPRPLDAKLVYWPAEDVVKPPAIQPALEDPLPEGPWVTLEDAFTVFWATNVAWASSETHLLPGQKFLSGSWSIVVQRNASRLSLAKLLLALDEGKHIDLQSVEVIQCRAFRLIPRTAAGYLSLDGEEIPVSPLQVWPSPFHGNVYGLPSQNDRQSHVAT